MTPDIFPASCDSADWVTSCPSPNYVPSSAPGTTISVIPPTSQGVELIPPASYSIPSTPSPPTSTGSGSGEGPGVLASTGFPFWIWIVIGLVLLAAGVAMVRRSGKHPRPRLLNVSDLVCQFTAWPKYDRELAPGVYVTPHHEIVARNHGTLSDGSVLRDSSSGALELGRQYVLSVSIHKVENTIVRSVAVRDA